MPSIEQLQKLLEIEPKDVFLNFGLAMELARRGDCDAAMTQFDRVLAIDPKYTAAYFHKARTLAEADRADEARTLLKQGIEIAAGLGDSHTQSEMTEYMESL